MKNFELVQNIFRLYNTCFTPFTAHTLQQLLEYTVQIQISQFMVDLSGPAIPNQYNLSHDKILHCERKCVL